MRITSEYFHETPEMDGHAGLAIEIIARRRKLDIGICLDQVAIGSYIVGSTWNELVDHQSA